ncbi:recombinase family protein [Pseudomonas viridiflava]|uniref:recombinase family protein n=1 Tax=Pseudomonas viridiflava TaxID=33069 RepID=UPI000F061AD1|nr:recombinase family protein [Pseudomonas viridiflava]
MPKIWPYIRFSSEEQKRGDSLRRQKDLIARFAARPEIIAEGAQIDESLNLNDLGVSGYTGKNLLKGRFKAFLDAVDSEVVKPGDYLAVEALNRITRLNPLESLPIILRLVQEKGVRIAITSSSQIYQRGDDISSLYIAIGELQRGYKESQEKGMRVKEAWDSKKRRAADFGEIATSRVPLWLSVDSIRLENGTIKRVITEIDERVAVVKEIFRLSDNNIGAVATARILTERGVPTFTRENARKNSNYGDFWQVTYVRKILANRAVLGRYQPMQWLVVDGRRTRVKHGSEIASYFPQIITSELFDRVQIKKDARRIEGQGNKGLRFSNLFTKIAFCSACGAVAHHVNKGKDLKKGGRYLVCYRAKYGSCSYKSWKYEKVEALILSYLAEADIKNIMHDEDKIELLVNERYKIESEQVAVAEMLDNFKRDFKALKGRVSNVERELAIENEARLAEIKLDLHALDTHILEAIEQQKTDIKNEVKVLQELDSVADEHKVFEVRSKINARLKLVVDSIVLNFELQLAEVRFKNGIVRHIHENGVFANILPPSTPEQSIEDMKEIEEWASLSDDEKKAKWANEKFRIVPLKI